MSLTKFNKSVTNHQSLPDKPTLPSAELKTLWDKAGVDIKNYLNQILTEELDSKISEFQTNINNNVSAINNNTSLINENTASINNMLNRVYPIGSIYMSVNNTNPSTIFGGTWVAWGAGKVPVGVDANDTAFNTVEKIGGEKIHILTIDEMPSHNHGSAVGDVSSSRVASYANGTGMIMGSIGNIKATNSRGGGQPHNNLQPYITCYMWKRTA